ncbi:MAG: YraN family protein [Planctomycetota bacterium]
MTAPRRRAAATSRRPDTSGAAGERQAAAFLRRAGYRLVAANLRTVHAEIDLLVRRRRTVVAVEVKARRHHPAPERHVDGVRLDRLGRALCALAPTLHPRPRRLRVDVVAVRWPDAGTQGVEIVHVPGLRTWTYDSIGARASSSAGWLPADTGGYAGPPANAAAAVPGRCGRVVRLLLAPLRKLLGLPPLSRAVPSCRR